MIGKNNTYRVLCLFFRNPMKNFQLREISRLVGLSLPTVISHVSLLEKEGLVKRVSGGVYDSFKANMDSPDFRMYKKLDTIQTLEKEVLPLLIKECSYPTAVVLFGSAARGEDVEKSDIDLLVLAKEKAIDLSKWEEKLNRRISLLFIDKRDIKKEDKELLNNLVNGVVLYGVLEVV